MQKFSDDYLAIMKSRSEVSFVEDTIASDLWKLLAGLMDYPFIINTGATIEGSSTGYVIQSEEGLKSFVYLLLHLEQDDDES